MSWNQITASTLAVAMLAALGTPLRADDKKVKDDETTVKPKVTIELDGEGAQLRSNLARRVLGRFWIGIQAAPSSPVLQSQLDIPGGVVVLQTLEGHAAAEAGIQQHDVITQVNGTEVSNIAEFMKAIEDNGDSEAKVTLYRSGKKKSLTVKPQARPEEQIRLGFSPDSEEFKVESERISKWLESLGREGDFEKFRMFRFGPGIVLDEEIEIDGDEFNIEDLEQRVRDALKKRFEERAERKVEAERESKDSSERGLEELHRELKRLRKDLEALKKSSTKKESI